MSRPPPSGYVRDPAVEELERIGILIQSILQDMRDFSVDTGHLLEKRVPHTRMFRGLNTLWMIAQLPKQKLLEAERRKDEDGIALYTDLVKVEVMHLTMALKNFHPYQKSPRTYLTPQLRPQKETKEALVRPRFAEFIKKLQTRAKQAKEGEAAPPKEKLDLPKRHLEKKVKEEG